MSGRRNPVHLVGTRPASGFTMLSNELVRDGGHKDALGPDGYLVLSYLVSCASVPAAGRRPWETSVRAIADRYGMGRVRVQSAVDRLVKDGRLLIRECTRDGAVVEKRSAYVVCAGGRRFTDAELLDLAGPVALPPLRRAGTK